jgi:hypothetical protein
MLRDLDGRIPSSWTLRPVRAWTDYWMSADAASVK